ncbi:hypothetical protein C8R46DRAFT_911049 [Mycena filopes]|nr:hypothetical protein C8R46DRAFT_911049 [Mycena filopes]
MDTDESTPPHDLTRAEGLWFEDCGLIIQAETTLFRVSRDFLAMRSPVFGDMLSLPPPKNAELMEGCPFVRLPDGAEDMTYFLKALLYSEFFERAPVQTSFPVVAGVLRMSHKYEVDVLRKRALVHLSSAFPTTLFGWDTRFTRQTWFFTEWSFHFEAISLARQTSALWILPTAFYHASTAIDIGQIMMGIEGCDVTPTDAIACTRGRRFLDTTANYNVLDFLCSPTVHGCESPDACSSGQREGYIRAEDWRKYDPGMGLEPCAPLEIWDDDDFEELEVCNVCKSHFKSVHQLARQAVWDRLPALFELPSWAELEQMKAAALK